MRVSFQPSNGLGRKRFQEEAWKERGRAVEEDIWTRSSIGLGTRAVGDQVWGGEN